LTFLNFREGIGRLSQISYPARILKCSPCSAAWLPGEDRNFSISTGHGEPDSRIFWKPLYQPGVRKYAVDDIDALDEGYSRELLQLQNAVYGDPDARLVCAGRFPPKELPLPEGVKNRLLGGPCYFVAPLNEEDRFRELSRQAALRGILLTPDMTQWMSRHLPRDMRSLTRIMDVANQIALHSKRRVTLQIIREAVKVSGVEEKDPEL